MESIFRTLGTPASTARDLYLAWDFTVASGESLSGRMLQSATTPSAQLGDTNLADLKIQGRSPAFTIDRASPSSPPAPGARHDIARRVEGTVTVPCYLDRAGCPAGARLHARSRRHPAPTPGNTTNANFICNIPRRSTPHAPGRRRRSTATACSAARRGQRRQRPADRPTSTDIVFCATDWIGMSDERHRERAHDPQRPVAVPHAGRPAAAGHPQLPVPGPGDDPPAGLRRQPGVPDRRAARCRPTRLFFDGDSQGGIIGRRGDGGRARLHPRGARRAGDELQPAAHAQRRLRRVLRDPLPGVSRRAGAPAAAVADPDAVGPRRGRTATPST